METLPWIRVAKKDAKFSCIAASDKHGLISTSIPSRFPNYLGQERTKKKVAKTQTQNHDLLREADALWDRNLSAMLREQSGCCRACRRCCGRGSGCISSPLNFIELFLVICLQFQPRWLPPQHPDHRLLNPKQLEGAERSNCRSGAAVQERENGKNEPRGLYSCCAMPPYDHEP